MGLGLPVSGHVHKGVPLQSGTNCRTKARMAGQLRTTNTKVPNRPDVAAGRGGDQDGNKSSVNPSCCVFGIAQNLVICQRRGCSNPWLSQTGFESACLGFGPDVRQRWKEGYTEEYASSTDGATIWMEVQLRLRSHGSWSSNLCLEHFLRVTRGVSDGRIARPPHHNSVRK